MTTRKMSLDGLPLDKYGMDKYGRFYDHLDDPEEEIGEDGESFFDTPRLQKKWTAWQERRDSERQYREEWALKRVAKDNWEPFPSSPRPEEELQLQRERAKAERERILNFTPVPIYNREPGAKWRKKTRKMKKNGQLRYDK